MKPKKQKKSSLLEVTNHIAADLYEAGVIDAITMREYDLIDIPPAEELTPYQIKLIRLHEKVSQAIFAKYLNTSTSTVRQWEQGGKHPRGTSLRLLNLVASKGLGVFL
ncbi:MAG TPA: helix-turn-helix domain-containing protein [Gammaproteobacteria bacterium]|nr:helix-turn-helix domain-containing protein [Gammaproteobacteria bacterium]